jgi:hypothetical protein
MNWDGVSVDSSSPLELAVRSQDAPGRKVRFESSHFESSPFYSSHLRGLFEVFKAARGFPQARVGSSAGAWPGEIDLPPGAIDRELKRTGERGLR